MTPKRRSQVWQGLLYALLGNLLAVLTHTLLTPVLILAFLPLYALVGGNDSLWGSLGPDIFFPAFLILTLVAGALGLLGGGIGAAMARKRSNAKGALRGAVAGGMIAAASLVLIVHGGLFVFESANAINSTRFERALQKRENALATVPTFNSSFQELIDIDDYVYYHALSPDGKTLVYALQSVAIRCDMREAAHPCQPLAGDSTSLCRPEISQDGRWLAAIKDHMRVVVWSAVTGEQVYELTGGEIAFSPDSSLLASIEHGNIVLLWDLSTGREIARLRGTPGFSLSAVAFSPDGRLLAAGANSSGVFLWDRETLEPVGRLDLPRVSAGEIYEIAFSPDSSLLAASTRWDLAIWDVEKMQRTGTVHEIFAGTSIDFSPDGRWIASSSFDKTIYLWDASTAQPVGKITNLEAHSTQEARFLPDGSLLVLYKFYGGSWISRIGILTLDP